MINEKIHILKHLNLITIFIFVKTIFILIDGVLGFWGFGVLGLGFRV